MDTIRNTENPDTPGTPTSGGGTPSNPPGVVDANPSGEGTVAPPTGVTDPPPQGEPQGI